MSDASAEPRARVLGRYALFGEIAAGGMATVHFGRLLGPVGFSRTVAIKRLHPQFAKDPEFVSMFLDEARLAARIQHPNVVATLDVVALEGELFLVMEYVPGESLSKLIRAARKENRRIPPRIVAAILAGVLHGLHAAHEAKSERAEALEIVHRDVSPQNVLVGVDGVARVLDFGVAKAALRAQSTRDGPMKGKMSYMAPEQLGGEGTDRRTDIFAASIVLWEALTGKRLFDGNDAGEIFGKVLKMDVPPPSMFVPSLPRTLDQVVARGLERDLEKRFKTAREFAIAIEKAATLATSREVGEWVEGIGGEPLSKRAAQVAEIESISSVSQADGLPKELSSPRWDKPAPPSPPSGEPELASSPSQVSVASQASQPSMASQVSNLTLSTYPSEVVPERRRRPRGALVAGFAVSFAIGLGVVGLALYVSGSGGGDADPSAAGEASSVPIAPTGRELEPVDVDSLAAETIVADAAASGADAPVGEQRDAAAKVAPEPAPKVQEPAAAFQPKWKSTPRPAPKPAPEAKPKPPGSCNPPYTVDSKGVRRLKAHCL